MKIFKNFDLTIRTAEQDKLAEQYHGFPLSNPIKRNILNGVIDSFGNGDKATHVTKPTDAYFKVRFEYDNIFAKANVLTDLKFNTKSPHIELENVLWGEGASQAIPNINSDYLLPHRISCFIDVSRELINQTEDYEKYLIEVVVSKMKEALLEGIFGEWQNDISNKNLIHKTGVTPIQITSFDDLVDFKYSGDINKVENTFIISPKAQQHINKMKDGNLLNGDKLFGADLFNLSTAKDGYIFYLPLNLLSIAQWGVLDYTIDKYTRAADGLIRLNFQTWFDWDFVNAFKYLKIGYFADENTNQNEEENNNQETSEQGNGETGENGAE